MRSRKTIGVIIGQIGDRYHSQMWPSLIDLGKKYNVGLLLFIGQSIKDPVDFKTQENVIYSFIDKKNVDGLIVFGSVGNYLSDREFREFLSFYDGIPIVLVSRKVEGYPSVNVENYDGMYELVEHMIVAHGRNKIAFIRGLMQNPEAEKRYQAYQDALKANGIPFEEDLVAVGTFAGPTGAEAVTELLDKRKVKFDCLVAANDDMLLWAHKVLVERKIRIPEDISIGGFDNLPETNLSDPPITTVEQPLSLLSYRAGELLIRIMNGEKPENLDSTVSAKIVVRKSCGCFTKLEQKSSAVEKKETTTVSEEEALEHLEKIKNGIFGRILVGLQASEYPYDVLERYVRELLDAFLAQMKAPIMDFTVQPVIEKIIYAEKIRYVTDFWTGAVNLIQDIVCGYLDQQPRLTEKAKEIFRDWQYSITQIGIRSFNNERNSFWAMQWSMLSLTQALSTTFEIDKIKEVLASRQFSEFELYACNIALYESSGVKLSDMRQVPSERSRLIFAYNRNQNVPEGSYENMFSTAEIAPFDLFADPQIDAWGIFPLIFEDVHFGYMSFELHKYNYYNYIIPNTLRENISTSLNGAFLIQELKNTQNQLMEAVKIAKEANYHKSKVLVNMSHELRTPLNSINGITELLQVGGYERTDDVLRDLKELLAFDDKDYPGGKKSPEIRKQLRKYARLLEKGSNTKPYFFMYLKSLIAEKKGVKSARIIRLLNGIIRNLDNEYQETMHAYKHIKEAGVYLLGLIDMVLNLSKVETGKLDVFRTKVALRGFIESVIQDTRTYIRSRKKEDLVLLEHNVDADVPETGLIDRQKVKEVLLNLLTNSVKYTEKGKVAVNIGFDGKNIKFTVTDNGIGISENEKNKIFTEFGRTEDAKSIEGTGLGLMFSKKLVELQEGEIGFLSQYGKGSTFWFTIPLRNKI